MAKPGRGSGWDLILLLLLSLFFNPSVTTCHLPYILLRKTQRRRVRCIPLSLLLRFYIRHLVRLLDTAGGGVLKYPFDSGTWILILRVDFPIFFQNIGGREILFLSWSSIFYVVSGNYSTFSPVSRSGIGERPKERSSGGEGLKR